MKKFLSVLLTIAMLASCFLAVVPAYAEGEGQQQAPAQYVTNQTDLIPLAESGVFDITKYAQLATSVEANADFKFSTELVFDELGTDWQQASVVLVFANGTKLYTRMARNGDNDKGRWTFQTIDATSQFSAEKIVENVTISPDDSMKLAIQRKKGAVTVTYTMNNKKVAEFAANDLLPDFDYTQAVTAVQYIAADEVNYHFYGSSMYANEVTQNVFAYTDPTSNWKLGPINTVELKLSQNGGWIETCKDQAAANFDFTWETDIQYADLAVESNLAFWVDMGGLATFIRFKKNANKQLLVEIQTKDGAKPFSGSDWSETTRSNNGNWSDAITCDTVHFAYTRNCADNKINLVITELVAPGSEGEEKELINMVYGLDGEDYKGQLYRFKVQAEAGYQNVTFKHTTISDTGLRDADYTTEVNKDGTNPAVAAGIDFTWSCDIQYADDNSVTMIPSFDFTDKDGDGVKYWQFSRLNKNGTSLSLVSQINDGEWSQNYTVFSINNATNNMHLEMKRDAANNKLIWKVVDNDTQTVLVENAEYQMVANCNVEGKKVDVYFTYFRFYKESGASDPVKTNCKVNAVATRTVGEFKFDTTGFTATETHNHVYDQEVVDAAYQLTEATETAKATYAYSCRCGAAASETKFSAGELKGVTDDFTVEITPVKNGMIETNNIYVAAEANFTWKTTVTIPNDGNAHDAKLWIDFQDNAAQMRIQRRADGTFRFTTQAYSKAISGDWTAENIKENVVLADTFNIIVERKDNVLTMTYAAGDVKEVMAFNMTKGEESADFTGPVYRVKYGHEGNQIGEVFSRNSLTYNVDAETQRTVTNFKFNTSDVATVVETPIAEGPQALYNKVQLIANKTGWGTNYSDDIDADEGEDFTFSFDVKYDPSVLGSRDAGIWIDMGTSGFFTRFRKAADGKFRITGQICVGNTDWSAEDILENLELENAMILHVVVERKNGVMTVTYQDSAVITFTANFHDKDVASDLAGELHRIKFLNEAGVGGYTIENIKHVVAGVAQTDFQMDNGDCFTYNKVPVYATPTCKIGTAGGVWQEWTEEAKEEELYKIPADVNVEYAYDLTFTDETAFNGVAWFNFASTNSAFYYRIKRQQSGETWNIRIETQLHVNSPDTWSDHIVDVTIADVPDTTIRVSQKKYVEGEHQYIVMSVQNILGKVLWADVLDTTVNAGGAAYDFDISGGTDILRVGSEGGIDAKFENYTVTFSGTTMSDMVWKTSKSHVNSVEEWGEWVITQQPTCGIAGKATRTQLSTLEVEEAAIAPTGLHNYGEWTTETAPGCTTKGKNVRTCSVCELSENKSVPAKGHSYADQPWTVDVAATETSKGSKSQHCSVCGTPCNETEIPKLEPQTTEAPAEEPAKKGCGSTLGVSALALVLVSTLGMGLKRKH